MFFLFRGLQGDSSAEYSGQDASQMYAAAPGNNGYVEQPQGYASNNGDGDRRRKIRDSPERDSYDNGRSRRRRDRSASASNDVG